MQQYEVIDIANVVLCADAVLDILIKRIQEDVGEELARQIADWQSKVCRLVQEALMCRH